MITWACSLPAFSSLAESDRKALLEASWAELFILGAAEKGLQLDTGNLLQWGSCGVVANARGPEFDPELSHVAFRTMA